MGLTDSQMENMRVASLPDRSRHPVEHDVLDAVSQFMLAWMRTNRMSLSHRLFCLFGNDEAKKHQAMLEQAKRNAKSVVERSDNHTSVFKEVLLSYSKDKGCLNQLRAISPAAALKE